MKITTSPTPTHGAENCLIFIPFFTGDTATLSDLLTEYGVIKSKSLALELGQNGGSSYIIQSSDESIMGVCPVRLNETDGPAKWKQAFMTLTKANRGKNSNVFIVDIRCVESVAQANQLITSCALGIALGHYEIGLFKSGIERKRWNGEVRIVCNSKIALDYIESKCESISDASYDAMDLVNHPANIKTPRYICKNAERSGRVNGYEVEVLKRGQLQKLGMHALLAVNQGSNQAPRCILAQYKGSDDKGPSVALVGKGVTFDTGGLSIKGSKNMHYMKSDMGGAAAVLGAIEVVAKLKLPVNVFVVTPLTDNSISSKAVKPGDVISSYEGSNIEVIDTDAEGRLILADGLAYASKNFKPDYLIDMATLTGSIVRALGPHAAGLMTANDELAGSLIESGDSCGERLWRMPMWPEYDDYMKSEIADIKNLSDKAYAGAITAAKFLEHFTGKHKAWAHIDIAGTAYGISPVSEGYSATAYGLHLLVEWLEKLSNKTV